MRRARAYLRLIRAPALPTAASNILMGYLVANGTWTPAIPLAILLLASTSIYSAGMVLNDVADLEEDQKSRPHRPIPSGEVALISAQRIGWGLLVGGVGTAIVAGVVGGLTLDNAVQWTSGLIGVCLGLVVVAYDFWLKRFWVGTVALGLCRLLNVLLGMSLGLSTTASKLSVNFSQLQWAIAAGIGVYIVGVSVLARRETERLRVVQICASMILTGGALIWLASLPWWLDDPAFGKSPLRQKTLIVCLFTLIFLPVVLRMLWAIRHQTSRHIQQAVTSCLFSLIFIDAILCASVTSVQPSYAMMVALLIVPSLLLSRWAYAT